MLKCKLCGGTFNEDEPVFRDCSGNAMHDECAAKACDPTEERADERSDLCEK